MHKMVSNDNAMINQAACRQIFLIEDDQKLSKSIAEILSFAGYSVLAYSDPIEFFDNLNDQIPAVVVSDVRMPGMSGVELQTKLLSQGRKIPIIFISGESTVDQAITAMKQGAIEFLVKPFTSEDLLAAVAKAIEQETQVMQAHIRQSAFEQKLASLSPRQRQAFSLLVKGYSNAELAKEMSVAVATVKQYKQELMYKLSLRSLSELIALSANATSIPTENKKG